MCEIFLITFFGSYCVYKLNEALKERKRKKLYDDIVQMQDSRFKFN